VAGGGKFGDINSGSGSDINLPAGTLILSPASNSPIFITDTAYTLKATDTQQYVGAYSAAPGSSANASAGVFNQWSGNVPYSKSAFGSLAGDQ
jgi:hypothetical protein